MRIAHVVSTFPPYRGGMGNVAREIAERTARRGHEVMVVTPTRQNAECRMQNADRVHRRPPTVHYSPPLLRFGNAAWCPDIGHALEQLRPDVVHLHWPFIGGVAPVLAWRRSHISHLTSHVSGLVVQYHMDLLASGARGAAFAAYERFALPRTVATVDRIVVSSLDYARHGALARFLSVSAAHSVAGTGRYYTKRPCSIIPSALLPPDRIVEIPLGVDIQRFAPSERGVSKFQIPNSKFQILFIGGLDRAHAFKGVPVLLDAVARVPDARLRVVGDGDLRSSYERRVRDLGIADRVEFLGAVSDAELPEIYRSADVLVLPSTARSEAFGLVLLEAGASGIPVIASDLPGVRSVVVDGETGFLVPPGDAAAFAERLAVLARDRDRARRMGAAGRARVMARYDWEQVVDRWIAVYEDVCGR